MRLLRSLLVVPLVGAVIALAGCTQGDPPDVGPSTSRAAATIPSADATPSASATPSQQPQSSEFDARVPPLVPRGLAGPPSKEAAMEVATYFMSLFPYAQATGDHKAWIALSGRDCDYCANSTKMFSDLAASGVHSVGGEIVVLDAQAFDHKKDQYAVLLHFKENPSRTETANGDVVKEFPDTLTVAADMVLAWGGDAWTVVGVVIDVQSRE